MRLGKTTIFKTIGAIGLPVAFGTIAVTTFAMAWSANTSAAPIVAPSVLRSSATTTAAPTTTLAATTTSSTTTSTTSTTSTTTPPPPPPPPTTAKKVAAKPKPAPAPAPAPVAAPITEVGGVAAQCIALTNNERASNGLPALAYNSQLQAAAQGWSDYQASTQTMAHTAPGSSPGSRITAAGYGWHAYGENVAAGQGSCASVVSAWMASPGHRANILNATFVHIGVALAKDANGRTYWTMDLAAP